LVTRPNRRPRRKTTTGRPPRPTPADIPDDEEPDHSPYEPAYFAAMRHVFENRPTVMHAVDCLDRITRGTVDVARTLLIDLIGKREDEEIDNTIAAACLRDMKDLDAVRAEFEPEVLSIADELRSIKGSDDMEARLLKVSVFSPEAKAIFVADLIVDMESATAAGKILPMLLPEIETTIMLALDLKKIARLPGMEDALVDHALQAYNELSIAAKGPLALIRNNEREVQHVIKKRSGREPAPKKEPKPSA
jgi:hypothetical protein